MKNVPTFFACFRFFRNGRFLFTGGYVDNTLRVHSLPSCQPVASLCGHNDVICAMDMDHAYAGYVVVTGARDGTVVLWRKLSCVDIFHTSARVDLQR